MDKKELLRLLEIHTKGTGLFPETMLAQMITESGMNNEKGLSLLSSKYNNYSGQKASGVTLKNGKEGVDYITLGTEEDFDSKKEAEKFLEEQKGNLARGKKSKIVENKDGTFTLTLGQPFRIFDTPEEGVKGHVRFLTGEGYVQNHKDRYKNVVNAETPEQQIIELKKSGYATDTDYVETLTSVLNDTVRVDFPQFSVVENDNDLKEEPTTESEGPTLKESPLIGEVDTEGVPIEATAKADKRYSRDVSNRKIERKEALDKFRDEFIALSKTDPRKKSMGGTGEGGTKNILAFDNKMEQLLLDNPIAVLLSDNWDGKKEALMLTEDFFEGKLTSLQEDVLSKMIEDRRSYGKLFDKVYNDFYFSEGAGGVPTGDAINRLNEVSEYENNPPKLNIVSTADGKTRVKLSDGRVVAVDESEALTKRGVAYNPKEYKDNLIKEGEEANKERMKGLLDSTGSYDEDGKLITQEGEVEKEKTKQTKIKTAQAEVEAEKRNKKIRQAEGALTGLKAAAGLLSLSEALRAPDVKTPELDPLILEALQKQKELSKSGLTAQEKGAAMQNMSDAYAGAMKNVLRASGGQRGLFLANQGTVDSNRIQGLNQLAAEDAAIRRENVKEYNQLASSVGQMKLNRDMNVEQMKQATLNNNRQILSGVGSNLLSDAISDVSYYMNPNRQATEDLIKKLSGKNNGGEYTNDLLNTNLGTASTDTKGIEIDAKNVDNNKNKTEG